mgnify:CR=1 FL=1|tara:strand:- start:36 stop:398 length:363 start_codon:yes stop_codon:yes gene_type:complete
MFEAKDRLKAPPLKDRIFVKKGINAEREEKIPAKIVFKNQLAICGKKNRWVLTHIPTGYKLNAAPYEYYEDVLGVAKNLKKYFPTIIKQKTVEDIMGRYKKLSRADKAKLKLIIQGKKIK